MRWQTITDKHSYYIMVADRGYDGQEEEEI
jgi:hypothetical protein